MNREVCDAIREGIYVTVRAVHHGISPEVRWSGPILPTSAATNQQSAVLAAVSNAVLAEEAAMDIEIQRSVYAVVEDTG